MAKVSVVAGVVTAFGAVVSLVSFYATQAILSGRGVGVSIGHQGASRVVVASALLAPVSALVGMALGAVFRQAGTTLVASVATLFVLPLVFSDGKHWSAVIDHALVLTAWSRPTEFGPSSVRYPWTTGGAWIVYAVWALAAAGLTVAVVHRRDQ
uniref:ABC transporter permease n=1 Tax=Streptomyces violaceusniger TaxID=68280 RepID=A0A6F8Z1S0_STRVO|nr:ABC transporter permease [Streptomyces violaceusniger]